MKAKPIFSTLGKSREMHFTDHKKPKNENLAQLVKKGFNIELVESLEADKANRFSPFALF